MKHVVMNSEYPKRIIVNTEDGPKTVTVHGPAAELRARQRQLGLDAARAIRASAE